MKSAGAFCRFNITILACIILFSACSEQRKTGSSVESPMAISAIFKEHGSEIRKCRNAQSAADDLGADLAQRVRIITQSYSPSESSERVRQLFQSYKLPTVAWMRDVQRYCPGVAETFEQLGSASNISDDDQTRMTACADSTKRLNEVAKSTVSQGKSDMPDGIETIYPEMRKCWVDLERIASSSGEPIWSRSKTGTSRHRPLIAPLKIVDASAATAVVIPTSSAARAPDLSNFPNGTVPEAFRGSWDEIVSDKCEAREPRHLIAAATIGEFEVVSDVEGVQIIDESHVKVAVTGQGDDGQYHATYDLLLIPDGRLKVDGGSPLRRCPA